MKTLTVKDSYWHMQPNHALALQLAKREVPALVYDAVNLEGILMSLPEVQTILDGITVGGHKISDQNIAINQAKTWQHLYALIAEKKFSFRKSIALELHSIAAYEESLAWGEFRSGYVRISGSDYEPPAASELDDRWQQMQEQVNHYHDIYDKAIYVFLYMARNQFFWDVNKRMGRFMMNAILLQHGFPIINVPAHRQQEFNQLMLEFYMSEQTQPMNQFLRRCLHEKIIQNFQPDISEHIHQ